MVIHTGIMLKKIIFTLVALGVTADRATYWSESSQPQHGVCFAPSCIHAASNILKNMNWNVNPCTDFYEFACGGFEKSADIHDTGKGIDRFELIKKKIWNQAKKSLEKENKPGESKNVEFAKNLYKSCIQPSKIDQFDEIFYKLGGLPIIEGKRWNSKNFFWPNLSQAMHETGFFGDFFDIEIEGDINNGTRRMIHLKTPQIFADDNEGIYEIFHSRYVKTISDLTRNEGVNWTSIDEDIYNLFDLMVILDYTVIDRPYYYYNPMTISALNKTYPSIPWLKYLNQILKPAKILDDEVINIQTPSYLVSLPKILKKTHPRTQANFMLWRHVVNSLNYIEGQKKNSWEQCVDVVNEKFPKALISLYERDYFNDKVKDGVAQLTTAIHDEFIKTLENRNWNNDEMKNITIINAKYMAIRLSYNEIPSNGSDPSEVDENYKIVSDNFLQNMLNINIHKRKLSNKKFREPIVDSIFKNKDFHDLGSFPKYNTGTNTILLPPGSLQGAIFDKDRPKYMNYGALGSFIGHEMTHMIVDDNEIFGKSGQCIVDDYNKRFVLEDYMVNGLQTLRENFADIGGMQLAYSAYENWTKFNEQEPKLPGLHYSPRQLFWISYANMFCSRYRDDQLIDMVTYGLHSPPSVRVIGSFSNFKDFLQDFECPKNSKMYQHKSCTVW